MRGTPDGKPHEACAIRCGRTPGAKAAPQLGHLAYHLQPTDSVRPIRRSVFPLELTAGGVLNSRS